MAGSNLLLGIFFVLFVFNNATKLNFPRVLLPIFDKVSINFTLEVIEKGCFRWTSSRQDLILITPLYEDSDNECSYRAVVTVLSRERRRNTAIVLAEDQVTGESLRCDVILDVIDKLGVHTTTRELYLEEAPETFELRAEDSQGNAFTTLEGIEFSWVISSLDSVSRGWSPALRFLTFNESPYHVVPPSLEKFEALRMKGYMVLLEGINTGTAKVTVHIPHPEYSHVPKIEVFINVLANIILEPSKAYILAGDTVMFRILQLKMGKLQEIFLNNQYFLEIEDSNIASISYSAVTGVTHGRTSVVLRDRNAPTYGSFSADDAITKSAIPSAYITVVEPMKLGVGLLPHNNWVTVEGEKHEIAFDLYTSDDQKITLGSKYRIASEVGRICFQTIDKTKNGSRLYGQAIKEGVSAVYGSFKQLSVAAQLHVFSELVLSPIKVILPYDPNVLKLQKIQFHVKGGDGSYVWYTQNPRLLHINQNGLATTVIRDTDTTRNVDIVDAGTALTAYSTVKVALSKNPKITRQAEVYFLPPIKLEIIKYNFETALRDYVHLHIAVYTRVNNTFMPFTKCDNLLFDLDFTNQIFTADENKQYTEEIAQNACQVLHLRSTAVGLTQLRVTYKFQDKILKEEVTLSVFETLTILNPTENEVVLPIGASRNVLYIHGPQRIFTLEAELTKTTDYNKELVDVAELHPESTNTVYAFRVLCRQIGKSVVNLKVYNTLDAKNFVPYMSLASTTVLCVKPRFLNLYGMENLRSSCPMQLKNSLLHIKDQDEKFQIEIVVQDAKNRRLMNITSLLIDWEFSSAGTVLSGSSVKYVRQSDEEIVEGVRIPGRELLTTTLSEMSKNVRIKGVVTQYDKKVLSKNNIKAEVPPFGIINPKTSDFYKPVIENEIRFMAVNTTIFSKDHVSIFLAKNRRERIPIQQGSGFHELKLSESGIVNVEFDEVQQQIIIVPLRFGHVQLEIFDRCLVTEPAHLSISVVSIGAIRVDVADRVERTKSIEAIVKLYDSNDNLLLVDPNELEIYDLSNIVFNSEILTVKLADQNELNEGEIRYLVTGNKLGETKIVFSAGAEDQSVTSDAVNIQVFSPLRLYPRNSTLVIGSNVQIYYRGGPQPNIGIVYQVHDQNIISMDSAIVTASKLGQTKITGKCIMKNPADGKDIVVSEDTVEVHVITLRNIQIKTPLSRIRSGAVMPASIWGVPNISPMILGSLDDMRVTWSTNQSDVVEIYSIFADAGIDYGDEDLISVRVKALNPGKAKIEAIAEFAGGKKLVAFFEVVVFKILELESPRHISMDWILMAPRSTLQLKTNIDGALYHVDTDSNDVVKVTSDGIVHSHETLGRDLIIAKTQEQSLPIGIEVKNVQYILASLEYPTLKLKQIEQKIPRGMNFIFKVSLHDNVGNELSHNVEEINDIRYEVSKKDVVDVQIGNNLTVSINLPRETNTLIAITLRDTTGVKHAEDYIKLSVTDSSHIYPIKTIFSVGDIICFDSPLTKSSIWTSSNEDVIGIDKSTGVAKVLGNRFKLGEKIIITNRDKASGSFIKYDVEVRDGDVVQMLKSFDIFSGTAYRAHLVIRNHMQVDKFTNLVAKNSSKCSEIVESFNVKLFTCRLTSKQALGQQLLEFYKVLPVFDAQVGRYACQIDLLSSFSEILGLVKSHDVHMELEALLSNGVSASLSLKLVPGIKVNPENLFITDLNNQEITVTGLDRVLHKVDIRPSDPKLIEVVLTTRTHGTHTYNVRALKEVPFDANLYLKVHSPVTQQDIKISVLNINSLQPKCSSKPFESTKSMFLKFASNMGLIVTALVGIATLVWVYVVCTAQREVVNESVFLNNSNASRSANTSVVTGNSSLSNTPSKVSLYPNLSPYYRARTSPETPQTGPQIYGDATLVSPHKTLNRRYL